MEGWISYASESYVVLCETELFSDEFWSTAPGANENPQWRKDFFDYTVCAHEIAHAITQRNCDPTRITDEGIAEYMGKMVIDSLADQYPSIAVCKEKRSNYDDLVFEAVNAENAERIFIEDYHQLSTADRGSEYVYGKYLWTYIHEHYGDAYYQDFCSKVQARKLTYKRGESYDQEVVTEYADILKEMVGDDLFTSFGEWCVQNNHLQEVRDA